MEKNGHWLDSYEHTEWQKMENWSAKDNNYFNMNVLFSFDLFMVYIPECKQRLRTMK